MGLDSGVRESCRELSAPGGGDQVEGGVPGEVEEVVVGAIVGDKDLKSRPSQQDYICVDMGTYSSSSEWTLCGEMHWGGGDVIRGGNS